jgi:phosphomannomutase
MSTAESLQQRIDNTLAAEDQASCDYLGLISDITKKKEASGLDWRKYVGQLYEKVHEEIISNSGQPVSKVSFGTSGWRGILGKDLFCKSVAQVCLAIVEMYKELDIHQQLRAVLGVDSFEEACTKGCVIGFDNRFDGDVLARVAVQVFSGAGIKVFYAGESTTGVLSATVLQLGAAFSINFTPSHNPLEYGGLKFNASDGGPAATEITSRITEKANSIIAENRLPESFSIGDDLDEKMFADVETIDSLGLWKKHVIANFPAHGLQYEEIIKRFEERNDLVVTIDSVHGASRLHVKGLFNNTGSPRLIQLREAEDVTFGGVAPEPSSENMIQTVTTLQERKETFKLGAIIDPDGDRIRFTDGTVEISMNQFGAMVYHFLHEWKNKKGMVAKTVATSNLANSLADTFGEEVFEPRVGFKEFKPVIEKALVCFEESDGITIIGHTPEKDAYIGLIVALDMVMTTGKNLGEYLHEIEQQYGFFYPDRGGITVSLRGDDLHAALSALAKYEKGSFLEVDGEQKKIERVIDIDGRKILFEDGSWLMIRPSGTEPKVRFYVESRTAGGTAGLIKTAQGMLEEAGLI